MPLPGIWHHANSSRLLLFLHRNKGVALKLHDQCSLDKKAQIRIVIVPESSHQFSDQMVHNLLFKRNVSLFFFFFDIGHKKTLNLSSFTLLDTKIKLSWPTGALSPILVSFLFICYFRHGLPFSEPIFKILVGACKDICCTSAFLKHSSVLLGKGAASKCKVRMMLLCHHSMQRRAYESG